MLTIYNPSILPESIIPLFLIGPTLLVCLLNCNSVYPFTSPSTVNSSVLLESVEELSPLLPPCEAPDTLVSALELLECLL